MFVSFRKCMTTDAHRIYELCNTELGYDFSEEQVTANIRRLLASPNSFLMVAVDKDDSVIGFVHAHNHDPIYAPPMKSVVALAVDPAYRMEGLGTALMKEVEKWARATGAAGIRVNSGAAQKNAGVFYKSLGFDYMKTAYNYRKMF